MGDDQLRTRAERLVQDLYGQGANFRDGQWEALDALLRGQRRVLVVQRTGWGKSLVYFLATRLLRDAGRGPTILISPLLSLMRNQVEMAARLGVRAARVDSTNFEAWQDVDAQLQRGAIDLLLISPERLANEHFASTTLAALGRGIGLFVVDEAHCISDWGHDFRPDYRRISSLVRRLPANVPLLATTATANDRVIDDIRQQLGDTMAVIRGPLARSTLRLQNIRLRSQAERLAWLAAVLPTLPGSGIVYCSTVRDWERVSGWLSLQGIEAPAYYGASPNREELEHRLLANDVKALVATVALGMGFDKPDLGFVVHFQKPGSVVDYYQRIGRAGRAVQDAAVVLLSGLEDDQITDYFIEAAFPSVAQMQLVLEAIERSDGVRRNQLQGLVNLPDRRLQQILKLLEVDGAIYREDGTLRLSARTWVPDYERVERITRIRRHEAERMRAFLDSRECLMEFLTRELDDPQSRHCGRCANCSGGFVPTAVESVLTARAAAFLRRAVTVQPRRQFADRRKIPETLRAEAGRAVCYYGDEGWGAAVREAKYRTGRFSDELVRAAVELLRSDWKPEPAPAWVTAVPSLRHPTLVPDFATRLARELGLSFVTALRKVRETPEQKTMENSAHQAANVESAFDIACSPLPPGPVLLVDDMVDSRWTVTVCARLLREHGAGAVYPLVLANSSGTDDEA